MIWKTVHSLFRDLMLPDIPGFPEILLRIKKLSLVSHELFMACRKDVRPGITTRSLAACFETELSFRVKGRIRISHIHVNVNEQAFHCLPGSRVILAGDILTVDLVLCDGLVFSDGAWTYPVGEVSPGRSSLIEQAWRTSCEALLAVRGDDTFSQMQEAVERSLKGTDFTLIREACGHGIGLEIHEEPEIPFFTDSGSTGKWVENTLCTIEPVLIRGNPSLREEEDHSRVGEQGCDSAYFEHVILVGESGAFCLNIPEINMMDCIDIFQAFN